jgi:hypothetical protein
VERHGKIDGGLKAQKKKGKIQGVKEGGLGIGEVGSAGIGIGVPKRDLAMGQPGKGKLPGRKVLREKVPGQVGKDPVSGMQKNIREEEQDHSRQPPSEIPITSWVGPTMPYFYFRLVHGSPLSQKQQLTMMNADKC